MTQPKIHIIGAGIAGLSAAVFLKKAGYPVVLYESSKMAGGRCRSFYDDGLGCDIDNGTHLILRCNTNVFKYLKIINARSELVPFSPRYQFHDFKSGRQWALNFSNIFTLLFSRVPNIRRRDFLKLWHFFFVSPEVSLAKVFGNTRFYKNVIGPIEHAVLNTANGEGQAKLLVPVLRKAFFKRKGAVPYLAKTSLRDCFVDPALEFLGHKITYNKRLKSIDCENETVRTLSFDGEHIDVSKDIVVFALPVWQVAKLMPGFSGPDEFQSIINVHFQNPGFHQRHFVGCVGGIAEWIFICEKTISVTISAADRYKDLSQEDITKLVWREVCAVQGEKFKQPKHQFIREKRATFHQTPQQVLKRPGLATAYKNLFLCGDYVNTGLPSTIESTILSSKNVCQKIKGERNDI